MTIAILGSIFLILMFLGMPVAFALGVPALAYLFMPGGDMSLSFLSHSMTSPLFNYVLIALPAFLLSGRMMNNSGVTDRLFSFAVALVGRFRGGLAYANVLASMMFASMSGTAVGDAGGLGLVEMKMMKKAGYRTEFAAGVTASSSVLGPLIPPSVTMVVVGACSQISVGRLFMGGIVPGILMTASLMIYIFMRSRTTKEGRAWPVTKVPFSHIPKEFIRAFFPLMTPVIIIGGITGGVVTPTEAAVIAIDYAVILGIVYKQLTWKVLKETLVDTVIAVGTFMIITSIAGFFTWMVTMEGLPMMVEKVLSPIANNSTTMVLLILGLFFLVVGCFFDTTAAVILLTPTLFPVVVSMGIDPVHFGVVMTVALVTGIITPPFGICLFVMSDVAKLPVSAVTKESIRYLPAMIITLILIIIFPDLVLYIPNLVFSQ